MIITVPVVESQIMTDMAAPSVPETVMILIMTAVISEVVEAAFGVESVVDGTITTATEVEAEIRIGLLPEVGEADPGALPVDTAGEET